MNSKWITRAAVCAALVIYLFPTGCGNLAKHPKHAVIYGDLAALISDYFYGITLLDISVFNHIMSVIEGKQDKILKLLGENLPSYKKYYFDSVIADGTILFDYKIHEGDGGKTNAIALLALLHYPEEIVEQSRAFFNSSIEE